ncbi:MAG: hypothetical protein ABJA90_02725, partial [Ginsengibacter sp.]
MNSTFISILNWSEVWALLIPLLALVARPKQPKYLKPVIIYLCVAFPLNLICDILSDYNDAHRDQLISNNPLYNMHSIVRFACFSYFFILFKQKFFKPTSYFLSAIYIAFLGINFIFLENFFYKYNISGNLLSMEALLLLIYCMLYYLSQLKSEMEGITATKGFWIVTGLSIYVAANFFVFLFYVPMITENPTLANNMWNVHNVAYILLCIFISKA